MCRFSSAPHLTVLDILGSAIPLLTVQAHNDNSVTETMGSMSKGALLCGGATYVGLLPRVARENSYNDENDTALVGSRLPDVTHGRALFSDSCKARHKSRQCIPYEE